MDLAFPYRINTDLETLVVIDRTPTGNLMLDHTLAKIGARAQTTDTRTWIKVLAEEDTDYLREQALLGFIRHGILKRRDRSFNWAFSLRRGILDCGKRWFSYPFGTQRHQEAEREIKMRIGNVLLFEDVPDPRDAALIGLVNACTLRGRIFPGRNIDQLRPRVEQLRKMGLIGRELEGAISDIEHNVKMTLSAGHSRKRAERHPAESRSQAQRDAVRSGNGTGWQPGQISGWRPGATTRSAGPGWQRCGFASESWFGWKSRPGGGVAHEGY